MTALAILIVIGPLAGPAAAALRARARGAGVASAAGGVGSPAGGRALGGAPLHPAPGSGGGGCPGVDTLSGFFLVTVAGVTVLAAFGSIAYLSAEQDAGTLSAFQVRL